MKKQLLIISVLVIIVSIFVSCSANSSGESIPTTAVTDSNGTTHYYEPVTESESTSVFAEIATDDNGKAVTKKSGKYVTKEHTTILATAKSKTSSTENKNGINKLTTQKSSSTTKGMDDADNVVEFDSADTTKETKATTTTTERVNDNTTIKTTTQKEIQPATDKDGWITKWY